MRYIYWDDFRKLIAQNLKNWRYVKYYRSSAGFKDTISICDFSLPKREGVVHTGYSDEDWYRDSFVCNAGWLAGACPLEDNPSLYNEKRKKWEVWPVRGARATMKKLVKDGVVAKNDEVLTFIRSGYWRL